MSEVPDQRSEALERRRSASRHTAVVLTTVLGVVATMAVFFTLRADDRDALRNEVEARVNAILTMNSAPLVRDAAAALLMWTTAGADSLARLDAVTEEDLERLARTNTAPVAFGPGLPELFVNLEYLPRVPSSDREAFERAVSERRGSPFQVVEQRDDSVFPAEEREEHFPVLHETGTRRMAPPGLDRYASEMEREAMLDAAAQGTYAAYQRAPFDESDGEFMIWRLYAPVYEDGVVPETVTERREALRGFLVTSQYSQLESWGIFVPSSIRGIEAIYTVDDGSQAPYAVPSLDADRAAGRLVSVNFGSGLSELRTTARALPPLEAATRSARSWWALTLGLICTAWAASVLLLAARRSREVYGLVDLRTEELRERTKALGTANESLRSQIAERGRAEQALRESEARYRLLAENAKDVIYTHDLDFICTYISPSVEQQRGYKPEELIGTDISQTLTPESRSHARRTVRAGLERVMHNPELAEGSRVSQIEALCADGSVITIENRSSFILDDEGHPIGVLGVSRDISERRRVECEKEELESRYRHAQKMEAIGTLAGGVAHDFNNLLTGILGYAELLKLDHPDDETVLESVEVIEKAAKRAKELTSQLLGFARKGKFQSVAVDLDEAIDDVTGFLSRTIGKDIEIVHRRSEPAATISGDPTQIHQLLLNLAVNARDAMPSGGRLVFETEVVEVGERGRSSVPGLAPGAYSRIRVSDTGSGIPEEKLERIFEPYFTDKEQGRGTGMGLAMVYGVAKNHGGVVRVSSVVDEGTTFRVYLPYEEAGSTPVASENMEPPPGGSGSILLVDDEEVVRDLAADMLAYLGYSVVTAADGVEGVELFREQADTIDLVLVDLVMPRMGGVECVARMREIDPDVRAIVSSGYGTEEHTAHLGDPGVVGFLQKPYRLREMAEVVAGALADRTSEQPRA